MRKTGPKKRNRSQEEEEEKCSSVCVSRLGFPSHRVGDLAHLHPHLQARTCPPATIGTDSVSRYLVHRQ